MKKLYKSKENSIISGVCAGLSLYLGIDVTIVRLIFVFLGFYHFLGVWVYFVLAVLLPTAPAGYEDDVIAGGSVSSSDTTKVIGGSLIVLGILALVSTLDIKWFSWMSLQNLWPGLIVILGILLLVRGFNSEE